MGKSVSRVPISKRLVLVNSTSMLLTKLLTMLVSFWSVQYLLKRIEPDQFAVMALITSLMLFVPTITGMFTSGVARYVTAAHARDDQEEITRITSSILPLLTMISGLLLVIGLLAVWRITDIFEIPPDFVADSRLMLLLLAVGISIRVPLTPFMVGLEALQMFRTLNAIQLFGSLLRVGLLVVLLLGVSAEAKWVVVAGVVSRFAVDVLTVYWSASRLPTLRYRRSLSNRETATTIIGFGAWTSVLQLASGLRNAADPLILNRFATAIDLNSFYIGSMVDRQLHTINAQVTNPLGPVMTAMHATEQRERLTSLYLRANRLSMWSFLVVIVPLLVFRSELLNLYLGAAASTYRDAATVLLLLLLTRLLLYPRCFVHRLTIAMANRRAIAIPHITAEIVNVLLTLFLVAGLKMGAIGSATSTLICWTFFDICIFWPLGVRLAGANYRRFQNETLLPGIIPGVAGLAVGEVFRWTLAPEGLWGTAIGVAVSMVAVIVGTLFCLAPADKKDLSKVIEKLRQSPTKLRR